MNTTQLTEKTIKPSVLTLIAPIVDALCLLKPNVYHVAVHWKNGWLRLRQNKKSKLRKMENNEVIFKKIPLRVFIDILNDAWNKGADYIDIIGVPDQVQDNIAVAIREEYMNANPEDEFEVDVELEHPDEKKDLSDEDLNQLI